MDLAGGQAELARKLSAIMDKPIKQQHVWNWLFRDEKLPGEYVIPIERATENAVRRHELRADLYPADDAA